MTKCKYNKNLPCQKPECQGCPIYENWLERAGMTKQEHEDLVNQDLWAMSCPETPFGYVEEH